jgi:diketogulonate reductase-like aldo/keto reductase
VLPKSASSDPVTLLTRRIPRTGEALPIVGLGTWRVFDVAVPGPETKALVEVLQRFSEAGARLIDTSPMYGAAEEALGSLIKESGVAPPPFLATKVWISGKREGIAQMEASFRKLRAKSLDLIQVHNLVDAHTHLETLEEWREAGRVRYTGVTHYFESAFDDLEKILEEKHPDFVQLNYSLGERAAERRLLPCAARVEAAVIVNRPFGSGELFARVRGKPLPPWADEVGCLSWAQYFLKYVLSHPAVTCAIPATGRADHLLDNLGGGRPPLPTDVQRRKMAAYFDSL